MYLLCRFKIKRYIPLNGTITIFIIYLFYLMYIMYI
nr:MAG TPA_asm: hypothetical protein [Caudoviricetes sp.]